MFRSDTFNPAGRPQAVEGTYRINLDAQKSWCLKKLWCCHSGELKHENFELITGLIRYMNHRKEIRKLTFPVLALPQSEAL